MIRTKEKWIGIGGLALSALLVAAGCAPPFSRAALDQVNRGVALAELHNDPGRYTGKWVMLAGVIVNTKNTQEASVIEVLERPMGRRGEPLDTDESRGRFLIVSTQYLDAAVYHPGQQITVIGEAAGVKELPLGEIQYRYPVVTVKEFHLWEPYSGPRFSIGVGVFHAF